MRIATLLLVSGLCCQAQIRELATTDAGDQLYFTSDLGLRNVDSVPNSKIIRWSLDRGMEIFAQRANQGDQGTGLSNPYWLNYPNVSGDGSVITFAGTRDCYRSFKFGCLIPNPLQSSAGTRSYASGWVWRPNARAVRNFRKPGVRFARVPAACRIITMCIFIRMTSQR